MESAFKSANQTFMYVVVAYLRQDRVYFDKSDAIAYNKYMRMGSAFLIASIICSCNHTNERQYALPLTAAEASLLGINASGQVMKVLRPQHAANHAGREDIPPTLVDTTLHPDVLKTEKEYEDLPISKKQLLARSIVTAADWDQLYRRFNTVMGEYESTIESSSFSEAKKKDYLKKANQADSWIMVSENPYILSTLRMLRKDRDLAPLIGEARPGMCPIIDDLDIFEIVIDNYIELYPSDKRGWDFLWFMMIMEEEEMPQFRIIKEHIQQKALTRFPYGKKIYEMVKDYGYVEAIPYGRRPLE